MNNANILQCFLREKSVNRSEETVGQYRRMLENYVDFIGEEEPTKQNAIEWFVYLKDERKNSPNTIRQKQIVLKQYVDWLVENGYIDKVFTWELASAQKNISAFFTGADVMNIYQHPSPTGRLKYRNSAILKVFISLALRVSELCNLKLNDFNAEEMYFKISGKGGKERKVYIPEPTANAIVDYIETERPGKSEYLFEQQFGGQMTRFSVLQMVKVATRRITGKSVSPHKLRHTAATFMYHNGTDLLTLQDILGHVNVQTTQRYTHIGDLNKKEVAKRMTQVFYLREGENEGVLHSLTADD